MKKIIITIALLLLVANIYSCHRPKSTFCTPADIARGQQLLKMSMSNLQTDEPSSGKMLIIEALQIFKTCNEYYWEAVSYEYYGYACLKDGNKIQAVRYLEKASDIYHSLNYPIDNTRFDLEKLIGELQYTSGILEGKGAVTGGAKTNGAVTGGGGATVGESKEIKEIMKILEECEKRLEDLMMTISHQ